MRLKILFYSFLTILVWASSCGKKEKALITERIQYDVVIKSPDQEWDWWIQNLEGPKREVFIKTILNAAYSGKVKAYDYFNQPLTVDQVKAIENSTDTILGTSPDPPYNDTTIIVERRLDMNRITKVRFLEEWRMNPDDLTTEKKVLGIAPILEVMNDDGTSRGFMPLFWVYLDKEYPGKLPAK
jgi:hypothetical protein